MATPSGERFGVEVESLPGATVVTLTGELDHDTAEPLRQALGAPLQADGGERLLVDLSRLDFCDSTGLNVLLHGRLSVNETGGSLELVGVHPPVERMFHITGADRLFRFHTDVEAALATP
ncbi:MULTISPECIES: STAS domain-containing protein [unclassified Streptomyces]|uniref:STAS domain-containing protein n=1 Tax=unclassified Streptomyces TaxID=2593676 RepID=UPI002E146345|nr:MULTISPECIES: STAS domain-containing protein [unclassified Streptomyces]WSR24150.1 STAS domain-containing protein [Streptomyces sp. NBC_01205]